jgi:hypothetical protein
LADTPSLCFTKRSQPRISAASLQPLAQVHFRLSVTEQVDHRHSDASKGGGSVAPNAKRDRPFGANAKICFLLTQPFAASLTSDRFGETAPPV